jgi:hypothetical protein
VQILKTENDFEITFYATENLLQTRFSVTIIHMKFVDLYSLMLHRLVAEKMLSDEENVLQIARKKN